jgi:hypothetical protein
LGLGRGDDRDLVFLLPTLDDLALAREPVHHERRRTFGVDQVDLRLGQLLDAHFEVVEDALELVDRPFADVDEEREHADPVGEQPAELFDPADAHRRLDDPDGSPPTR